jgi:hypothetical protein
MGAFRIAMLSVPSRSFRVRAAIALALLYALCILAPTAAFALSSNPGLAHCLTEDHVAPVVHDHGKAPDHTHDHGGQVQVQVHAHADGTAHQHHDDGVPPKHADGQGKAPVPSCCGLFSVVAIAGGPNVILGSSGHASRLVPALRDTLDGRGPDRINRPPIA